MMTIRIKVDTANPGQFFSCCGLLEFADRMCGAAKGWFEDAAFCISCTCTLRELLVAANSVVIRGGDSDSDSDDEHENTDDEQQATINPV